MLRHGFVSAGLRVIAWLLLCASAWGATPLLLRNPALSGDSIAFLYAGDLWIVERRGGEARRLTSVGTGMTLAGVVRGPGCALAAFSS